MKDKSTCGPALVKSPVLHIPIGEPIRNDEGRIGLRVKKPGEQEYEDVWLDQMVTMVAKAVNL